MKKRLISVLVAAGLVVGVLGYALIQNNDNPNTDQAAATQSFQVQYQVSDAEAKTVAVNSGETALAVLQRVATVVTSGEGANAFVTAINGRKADTSKREFWSFYVNGKQAEVGAGSYVLQSNDQIQWRIETY
ncbi:DUF4430 domain-containing protein [Candidatus Microgenomates bacterium]|nr:DUF4430 domain-containing protein [Candidatus Microgenomates bacterium]